jgi:hypothetical protein
MPGQTTERAFETYVEEILPTGGGWKSGSNAALKRLQEYRTTRNTVAVTGKINVPSSVASRIGKEVTSASP